MLTVPVQFAHTSMTFVSCLVHSVNPSMPTNHPSETLPIKKLLPNFNAQLAHLKTIWPTKDALLAIQLCIQKELRKKDVTIADRKSLNTYFLSTQQIASFPNS